MSKEAPPVTLNDSDTDFVFSLDLSASHAGFSVVDMVTLLTEAHYSQLYASRCLAGKSFADAKYGQARELLDCALLHLAMRMPNRESRRPVRVSISVRASNN